MKKKFDYYYLIIVIVCVLSLCFVVPNNAVFGSQTDWISQHIVFPDYFRKLFYDTGNLFPNFALSLGAGQNIYNFSYYGLLNPFILFSYLLPFIKMSTYLMVVNGLLYVFLGCICYYFLKSKFSKSVSLVGTLLLLFTSPILFHFHRHFMFVNYLPFLILGLIGTDRFFEHKGRLLLVFSVFFMITMSYYYSICGIFVLCLYALYRYMELHTDIKIKDMLKTASAYLIPIFIGIMICGVLLVPTFYVLLAGRSSGKEIELLPLLFPKFNLDSFLYGNYAMGFTLFSFLGILYTAFCKDREKKWLSIFLLILLIFPIFSYILNGTLYIRDKIFIPFIPLIILLVCHFLEDVLFKKVDFCKLFVISIILIGCSVLCLFSNPFIYLDFVVTLLFVYLYIKGYIKKELLFSILVIISFGVMLVVNYQDKYVPREYFKHHKVRNFETTTEKVLEREDDLVRFNTLGSRSSVGNINEVYTPGYNQDSLYSSISNPLYQKFYKEVFKNPLPYRNNLILAQNNNILFQMFMGVKYIYSDSFVPVGYQRLNDNVFVNEDVNPVFYGTHQLITEKLFDQLPYPYNLGTLLNSAVVKGKTTKPVTNTIEKTKLNYQIEDTDNLTMEETENYLRIISQEHGKMILKLNQTLGKNILLVEVQLANTPNCSQGDLKMTINGIDNVLTCKQWRYKNNNRTFHYVISSNEDLEKLEIKFSKGTFKIKDIRTYQVNYEELLNYKKQMSHFDIDDKTMKNDIISGNITMKEDGYFVTSIPYDKGFTAYVDGKEVATEVVNTAFLGFPLAKGVHTIRLEYHSPGFLIGVCVSTLGLLLFGFMIIMTKKNLLLKKKEKEPFKI